MGDFCPHWSQRVQKGFRAGPEASNGKHISRKSLWIPGKGAPSCVCSHPGQARTLEQASLRHCLSGAARQMSQMGAATTEISFLAILETGSPSSRCQRGWFLACRWLPSRSVLTCPFLCMSTLSGALPLIGTLVL